jgi:hypothetical protein
MDTVDRVDKVETVDGVETTGTLAARVIAEFATRSIDGLGSTNYPSPITSHFSLLTLFPRGPEEAAMENGAHLGHVEFGGNMAE